MNVTETKTESGLTLMVEGKVDTVTAPALQQSILTAFQKSKDIVLDLKEVPYMSSAGLRALLIGAKTANSKGGSMKVTNVQDIVMKVFEMSGFKKMLNFI